MTTCAELRASVFWLSTNSLHGGGGGYPPPDGERIKQWHGVIMVSHFAVPGLCSLLTMLTKQVLTT